MASCNYDLRHTSFGFPVFLHKAPKIHIHRVIYNYLSGKSSDNGRDNPSYGINLYLISHLKKRTKIVKPGQIVIFGDSLHKESTDIAIPSSGTTSWALYPGDVALRHKNGSNIVWADGHVTLESSNNLDAYKATGVRKEYWGN